MHIIEVKEFNFLEISKSPNIIISLKGKKNFSEESAEAKAKFMDKYFGVKSFQEFNQVHGTNIFGIDNASNNEFDGYLTKESKIAFAIKTADCIPLILWDDKTKNLCGLHCGWKGLKNGIIPKTIERNPHQHFTHAYIGPHICKDHFEVQSDFIDAFASAEQDISHFLEESNSKIYMNLRQLVIHQLHQYGVEINNNFSPCSYAEKDHFFSWRRDNANPHRNLTIAWF